MVYRGFPVFDEIYRLVDRFVARNADIAHSESLGLSEEGREIKAVYVTDKSVPDSEKQAAMVVCGRHGDELGQRVVGNALLEWLSSAEGAETRRRQLVIVVPVANPDGCVRNEFLAPHDGLSRVEQNTIAALAERYQPDAVIDVHSLRRTDIEAILTANTSDAGQDVFIHGLLAKNMAESAARQGYPFLIESVDFAGDYNNFFSGMCYERFHSVAFGMEVNHGSLGPRKAAESGVAAIKALLNAGNIRHPWEPHAGYPNSILAGDFFNCVRAVGRNSAERRASRSELWQHRESFAPLKRVVLDDGTIRVVAAYAGEPLSCGFSMTCRTRGFPVSVKAHLNGAPVEVSCTYRDNCSTYVCVDIDRLEQGEYELSVET